jgi:hypothetical protein
VIASRSPLGSLTSETSRFPFAPLDSPSIKTVRRAGVGDGVTVGNGGCWTLVWTSTIQRQNLWRDGCQLEFFSACGACTRVRRMRPAHAAHAPFYIAHAPHAGYKSPHAASTVSRKRSLEFHGNLP